MSSSCRESGSSFHVDYTIDNDEREQKNLTHVDSIDSEAIAEREEEEFGFAIESPDQEGRIVVRAGISSEGGLGFDIEHSITAETAEQLADAFAKAAAWAREVEATLKAERQKRLEEDRIERERQVDLPM